MMVPYSKDLYMLNIYVSNLSFWKMLESSIANFLVLSSDELFDN